MMMFFLGSCLLFHSMNSPESSENSATITCSVTEQKTRYDDYLKLYHLYPNAVGPLGDYTKQEVQIITDPKLMSEVEDATGCKVGIIAEDRHWIWLNDAVIFPNGERGVHGRMLWVTSLQGCPGVAVMPVLPDGKIALICEYRHATRSWQYAIPRGRTLKGESQEETGKRQVLEKTGMVAADLEFLGTITPNSGMSNIFVPVYKAKVMEQKLQSLDNCEANSHVGFFTINEIIEGFRRGYMTRIENGKECQIPIHDPYLSFALLIQSETH